MALKFNAPPLLRRQRGIFGLPSLFKDKSKSTENTTQNRDSTSTLSSDTTGKQTTTGKNVVELLGKPERDALASVVQALASEQVEGDDADRVRAIAEQLFARAQGAETAIAAQSTAAIEKARRDGERRILELNTSLARQAGGTVGNSFVAGATAEAGAGLEVDLAALRSQLNIEARGVATGEMQAAAGLFAEATTTGAKGAAALASVAQVLRGSVATEKNTQTVNTKESTDATEKLTELLTGTTTKKGTDTPSLMSRLIDFGNTKFV